MEHNVEYIENYNAHNDHCENTGADHTGNDSDNDYSEDDYTGTFYGKTKKFTRIFDYPLREAYIFEQSNYTADFMMHNIASRYMNHMDTPLAWYLNRLKTESYFVDNEALHFLYNIKDRKVLNKYFAYSVVYALPDEILEHFVQAGAYVFHDQLYYAMNILSNAVKRNLLSEMRKLTDDFDLVMMNDFIRLIKFLVNHGVVPNAHKLKTRIRDESRDEEAQDLYDNYEEEYIYGVPEIGSWNVTFDELILTLCKSPRSEEFELVVFLVNAGYDLSCDLYDYPLVTYCINENVSFDRIQFLVNHNSQIRLSYRFRPVVNNLPNCPLHTALSQGKYAIADFLISKGADIDWQYCDNECNSNSSPLHRVLESLHANLNYIKAMIARGINCFVKNRQGLTIFEIYNKMRGNNSRYFDKNIEFIVNFYQSAVDKISQICHDAYFSPEYLYGRIKRLDEFIDLFPDCHDVHPEICTTLTKWKSLPYGRERFNTLMRLFALVRIHCNYKF
jgi:hypothetical protein